MEKITRRHLLKSIPPAVAVVSAVALPVAVEAAATVTDRELLDQHIAAIKEILLRMHPEADHIGGGYSGQRVQNDEDGNEVSRGGWVMIGATVNYIQYRSPGAYVVERGSIAPILWVEARYSEMDRTWGHRAKFALKTPRNPRWRPDPKDAWKYYGPGELKFVRKVV